MYGLVVFETITTFLYFLKIREVALQNTNCLYEECRLFAGPWIPRKPWKPWKSIIFLEKTLRTFRIFFMVRIFSVCFYSLSCTRNYLVFKFLTGSSNKPWKVTKSWKWLKNYEKTCKTLKTREKKNWQAACHSPWKRHLRKWVERLKFHCFFY